jgi:cytochrome c-type biogenesis protein CcmE
MRPEGVEMSQMRQDLPTEGAELADGLRHRPSRLPLVGLALLAVAALAWLAVDAFQESVVYYLTPSELQAGSGEGRVRLAGLVIDDSLHRDAAGTLHFEVTDGEATVTVRFDGRVPDALEGGAEAVAEGRIGPDGVFEADTVLTRCASKFEAELEPQSAP